MILVTGASGFIGTHLVRRLSAQGERLRCLVRPGSPGLGRLRELLVDTVEGDLTRPATLERLLAGVTQVVHLVGSTHRRGLGGFDAVNHLGTRHLVAAARGGGLERIVALSPLGAGPYPALPYLYSRWKAEEEIRASGLPFVILQSSAAFGEGDALIEPLARLAWNSPVLPVPGTGETSFQPIWVGDVVTCLLRSLKTEEALGRTIPIGGPEHLTLEEILDLILRCLRVRRHKVHVPLPLVAVALRSVSLLRPHARLGAGHLDLLQIGNITSPDAVKRAFGFQPMPLAEGIGYIVQRTRGPHAAARDLTRTRS